MVDVDKLREFVKRFKREARPSSSNQMELCTVRDAQTIIDETAKLFERFISEFEKERR